MRNKVCSVGELPPGACLVYNNMIFNVVRTGDKSVLVTTRTKTEMYLPLVTTVVPVDSLAMSQCNPEKMKGLIAELPDVILYRGKAR